MSQPWPEQEALYYSSASFSKTSENLSTASTAKGMRSSWMTVEKEIFIDLCKEHRSLLKRSNSSQNDKK